MTAAKPLHDFMKYASLSVMAMIAMSCYILADTFFVSQGLGTRGLAALNLAIPAYNFIPRHRPYAGHGRSHPLLYFKKPGRGPGGEPDVYRHPVPVPDLFRTFCTDGTFSLRRTGTASRS